MSAWFRWFSTLSFAVLLLVAPTSVALAQGALAEPWSVIETRNFRVWYHDQVEPMAAEVALMAERAHELLAPLFPVGARGRTDILLTDDLDTANGSARVVPSRLVRLYGMAPEADSVLGDHDHWMWGLIVHEYTHILQLDSTSGMPRIVNLPGRKIVAPNSLLPRWLVEGYATWQESRQSGAGRMRSSLFEMMMRTALLDGSVPNLGGLSGSPTTWPMATGWYLYGSRFVGWVEGEYGEEAWPEFFRLYGRRSIPYGANIVARRVFGSDLPSLWSRWVDESTLAARELEAERQRLGLSASEPVSEYAFRSRSVAASVDGEVVAWAEDDGQRPLRLIVERPSGRLELDVRSAGDLAVMPDGGALILSQLARGSDHYSTKDLWRLDLESVEWTQLTQGARAREPSIDRSGRYVAYVSPHLGATHLHILDLETNESRLLLDAGDWGQLSQPTFTADGQVVASWMRVDEGRDLVLVDPDTGDWRWLTRGRHLAIQPTVHPDGRSLLFSADPDGIFEIYSLDLESGEVRGLTRGLGGAFSPAVQVDSRGEEWLWFSNYESGGWRIRRAPMADLLAASYAPPDGYERPRFDRALAEPAELRARRHRLIGDWRLLSWTPTVRRDSTPGVGVGLAFSGADPPERIVAQGDFSWESDLGALLGAAEILLRTQLPHLSVSYARRLGYRVRGRQTGGENVPWWEGQDSVSLSTSFPFSHPTGNQSLSLGYSWQRSFTFDAPQWIPSPEDPAPQLPTHGRAGALRFTWSWSNARSSGYGISQSSGTGLQAGFRWRSAIFGGDREGADASFSLRHYRAMPWRDTHVLALRLTGGMGLSQTGARGAFGVGGPAPQDLVEALIAFAPVGLQPVRGYAPRLRFGDRYYTAIFEYRLPLLDLDAGLGTLPFTLGRLHAAAFVDVADAWTGQLRAKSTLVGVGAELRLSTWVSYVQPASFRLGLARGLTHEGQTSLYLFYGGVF